MIDWLRRNRLFVLIAVTYAWIYQGGDPNQTSRLALVRSLVERHAVDITPDAALTIDKSYRNGKFYCDKAPGVSFVATVPYALMNLADRVFRLDPHARPVERVRLHMVVIVTSVMAGALAAWFLAQALLLLGQSRAAAELMAFGYALGTLAFPFSTVLFGHVTAAAYIAATFWLLLRWREEPFTPRRLAILGFLWMMSIITEYPTALLVACQGVYLLVLCRRQIGQVFLYAAAGAALPLLVHSLYCWRAFGAPWALPYGFVWEPAFRAHQTGGFLGLSHPTWEGFYGSLFSRYRGLFFFCPFLIVMFAGFGLWLRSGEARRELALCAAMVAVYILFTSSYYAWDGGGSIGPRHLVPSLIFFVVPIAWFFRRAPAARIATVALLAASIFIVWNCTSLVIQLSPGDPATTNQFYSLIMPAVIKGASNINPADVYHFGPRGDASDNLGKIIGIGGRLSYLPLWGLWAVCYAPSVWRRLRNRGPVLAEAAA
jgi:hypothetical protein